MFLCLPTSLSVALPAGLQLFKFQESLALSLLGQGSQTLSLKVSMYTEDPSVLSNAPARAQGELTGPLPVPLDTHPWDLTH